MPSIVSHTVVGLAGGSIFPVKNLPQRFWVLSIICPVLSDADSISFSFGIPYGHFFGHRGFFHSLFFAFILAIFVVCLFFREHKVFSRRWFLFVFYFFLLTATHDILDAFTNGGLGIALLSPFDTTRYFFPWQPIQVSPIGIAAFFSPWGLRVIMSEIIWVWLPSISLVILVKLFRSKKKPTSYEYTENTEKNTETIKTKTSVFFCVFCGPFFLSVGSCFYL